VALSAILMGIATADTTSMPLDLCQSGVEGSVRTEVLPLLRRRG
jgi:hypothetical protein